MIDKATAWALKQPIEHSPAKFILVAMAMHASGDDMTVYPSLTSLCLDTCQNRKTVIANIKRLVEWGYLEDTGQRVGATKSIVVFRLKEGSSDTKIGTASVINNLPKAEPKLEPLSSPSIGSSTNLGSSTKMSCKQSQKVGEAVPKSSTEVKDKDKEKEKDKTVKIKDSASAPVLTAQDLAELGVGQEVAAEFLAIRKRKSAPLTPLAMRGITREATAAGWTIENALKKCVERGWQSFEAAWVQSRNAAPRQDFRQSENDRRTDEFLRLTSQPHDDGMTFDMEQN